MKAGKHQPWQLVASFNLSRQSAKLCFVSSMQAPLDNHIDAAKLRTRVPYKIETSANFVFSLLVCPPLCEPCWNVFPGDPSVAGVHPLRPVPNVASRP